MVPHMFLGFQGTNPTKPQQWHGFLHGFGGHLRPRFQPKGHASKASYQRMNSASTWKISPSYYIEMSNRFKKYANNGGVVHT